jgi:3-oxoacyl-[acyl-carrier-protein] synthase-3
LKAFISGSGSYVPERVVTNEELAPTLGLTSEQIFRSSGIQRRRWVEPGTATSSLASAALRLALDDAGIDPPGVDYLIFGTMTPDRFIPGTATAVQKKVGLGEIPCLDIRATCCNALYGMQLAAALVKSSTATHVAVCLADIQSVWLDLSPAAGNISMLFGDGASAFIVGGEEKESSLEIIDVLLASDGTHVDDLGMRSPGTEFGTCNTHDCDLLPEDHQPRMEGHSVILQASRRITAACREVLQRNNKTTQDVRWIVPHQANANLLAQVARALQFSVETGGLISVIEDFGNTSSASMVLALDNLRRSARIQPGEYLLLPAFGAGFTWGAGLCRSLP